MQREVTSTLSVYIDIVDKFDRACNEMSCIFFYIVSKEK